MLELHPCSGARDPCLIPISMPPSNEAPHNLGLIVPSLSQSFKRRSRVLPQVAFCCSRAAPSLLYGSRLLFEGHPSLASASFQIASNETLPGAHWASKRAAHASSLFPELDKMCGHQAQDPAALPRCRSTVKVRTSADV